MTGPGGAPALSPVSGALLWGGQACSAVTGQARSCGAGGLPSTVNAALGSVGGRQTQC